MAVPTQIKFAVDQMLGRLARWLRILGYDTVFSTRLDDADLARVARLEGRVLLTRDNELARRRGVTSLVIDCDHVEHQLSQVMRHFDLKAPEAPFTRCSLCNALLEDASLESVAGEVPSYVARTQSRFARCPACRRIYWQGTHWAKMVQRLKDLTYW